MKIDVVLVSSNDNKEYYRFYPYIKPIWEKVLQCKCILIYIGTVLPNELEKYRDDIIMFEPIENLHSAFIAQNIRLLYPALLDKYENGILVGDVDSIPLNRKYFVNQVEDIPDNYFINYSHDPNMYIVNEYNLSFCLTNSKVWKEIFNINDTESIKERLIEWNRLNGKYIFDEKFRSKCVGFHFDQQILYKYIEEWKKENYNRLTLFNLNERKRLTPALINENNFVQKIKNGELDDNIFLRPYDKKYKINMIIKKILLDKYKN